MEALKSGKIAGAGFDVYLTEPLPPDENSFGEMENVVLQPHAGGVTAESSERSNRAPVDNVIAFLEGRPVNVVKPGHSSGALAHSRRRRRGLLMAWLQNDHAVWAMERLPSLPITNGDINSPTVVRLPFLQRSS